MAQILYGSALDFGQLGTEKSEKNSHMGENGT
jgi:hypothetical protein